MPRWQAVALRLAGTHFTWRGGRDRFDCSALVAMVLQEGTD